MSVLDRWTTCRGTVCVTMLIGSATLGGCYSGEPPVADPPPESPAAPEVNELVVGGLDYAFDLPAEIQAGPTEIVFENRGEVLHEVILAELKPGTTMTDIVEVAESGGDPSSVVERQGGILFAEPGEMSWNRLLVDLESGKTYGLLCFVTDSDGDPPHLMLGMLRTFTVP